MTLLLSGGGTNFESCLDIFFISSFSSDLAFLAVFFEEFEETVGCLLKESFVCIQPLYLLSCLHTQKKSIEEN